MLGTLVRVSLSGPTDFPKFFMTSANMTPRYLSRITRATTFPSSSIYHRRQQRQSLSTRAPSFPALATCPTPTCDCVPTPELPEGLEIDHKTSMNGLIPNYAQHVLVCTGKHDWPSKIEMDNGGDNMASELRTLVGRGGPYSDPFHNISVLNASFPSTPVPDSTSSRVTGTMPACTSIYLLPSFKYVPYVVASSPHGAEALVRGYLLPEKLHPMHDGLPRDQRAGWLRQREYQGFLRDVRDVQDVLVLVCGHGGRDQRCGLYGPALQQEFEARLPEEGVEMLSGPVQVDVQKDTGGRSECRARVGLISHIGGHKFAGNVILYLPPTLKTTDGAPHPLAGHGIWYGRVEPRHVQGIVGETILKGYVITELLRGGIGPDGGMIRL